VASSEAGSRLVLGSTSTYRRELLTRLGIAFETARPDVDESPLHGEHPQALAVRLARAKAQAVARENPGAWVIGSDQVAAFDAHPIGKSGAREAAIAQLTAMSGREVVFHTALCLARGQHEALEALDTTRVRFRALSPAEIARYVDAEQPFDCAGSFKCEGLGIALFESIESSDPTALVGLPLIATARLLRDAGFAVP